MGNGNTTYIGTKNRPIPSMLLAPINNTNHVTASREERYAEGDIVGSETSHLLKDVNNLKNRPTPASVSVDGRFNPSDTQISHRLFDACAAVKILTSRIAMHLSPELRERLFRQVDMLHDLDEWQAEDAPVNRLSFDTFLKTILQIEMEYGPGLGLSHSGNLLAAWVDGRSRLTMEFTPNGRVYWNMVRYIDGDDELPERNNGDVKFNRVLGSIPQESLNYFFNKG